jgi:spermidine synthase/Flp pilus assembly protein TadD
LARLLALAFLSGAPALVYEVVWTREVALLVGAQIEAVSGVLVAFFGGLALGARWLGPGADRSRRPLLRYAALEASAGALAIASSFALRALGDGALAGAEAAVRLAAACALLLPVTLLLGGTLAALLREATGSAAQAPRIAAALTGSNTAGSVAGVACAAAAIPVYGLRASLLAAGLVALAVAAAAGILAGAARQQGPDVPEPALGPPPRPRAAAAVLAGAALAGAATLAYEVLVTRGAGLRLGSSLFAWALVLGLFLSGLALGNLALARLAASTSRPRSALAALELAAAAAVATGIVWLLPGLTAPASGLTRAGLAAVAAAVLPPAFLMGGAFPLFVRLGDPAAQGLARSFARVSAANTAGGIAGALLAPFVLLPGLGLPGAAWACAAANALIGVVLLAVGPPARRTLRLGLAACGIAAAAWVLSGTGAAPLDGALRLLFVEHGSQASVVVTHDGRRRDLIVDGDPEASTGGSARRTEEMLAVLPLLLHPQPRRLLEVGFGSGITLGTVSRFPLDAIECVEISASVLRAAALFAPDNRGVAAGRDPRIRITRSDGRAFLARHRASYDVVIANTLHPWSLGATGLYSREYFERMAASLRPGGLAVQWLPVERIGPAALAAILRTMLEVFPHGSLWWGFENILVVGRSQQAPEAAILHERVRDPEVAKRLEGLGLGVGDALWERRLGSFAAARRALGPGPILSDDLPSLELVAAGRPAAQAAELAVVAEIATAAAAESPAPLRLWLESRLARAAGREAEADRKEDLAAQAGLSLAVESRAQRLVARAERSLADGNAAEVEQRLLEALAVLPRHRDARFALALLRAHQGRSGEALAELGRLLELHPADAEAWNQRGTMLYAAGDRVGARRCFEQALEADPHLVQALGNAGLLAIEAGEPGYARLLLDRLRAISPLGPTPEERALLAALLPAS